MDLPDIFAGLNQRLIQEAFEHFRVLDIEAGVRIIEPGDQDATLVVVGRGDLQIEASGSLVARAGSGDVLGEDGFFGDGVRKLGVWTRGPSRLLVLERPGYEALRALGHPVTQALEERALAGLESRFARVASSSSQLVGEGNDIRPPGGGESLLGRLASMLRGPTAAGIADALAAHPNFAGAPRAAVERLVASGEVLSASRGEVLLARGDRPTAASFVISGAVDVAFPSSSPGRGYAVARLGPGDAFGLAALVPERTVSGAQYVVRDRVQLLSVDPLRWIEATQGADDAATALRVAAIRASNDALVRAAILLAGLSST